MKTLNIREEVVNNPWLRPYLPLTGAFKILNQVHLVRAPVMFTIAFGKTNDKTVRLEERFARQAR